MWQKHVNFKITQNLLLNFMFETMLYFLVWIKNHYQRPELYLYCEAGEALSYTKQVAYSV